MSFGGHGRLQFLEAALASAADGVAIVDAEGRLVFVNDAGRRLVGTALPLGSLSQGLEAQLSVRHVDGRPMAPYQTPLAKALEGERLVDFPALLALPQGQEVHFSTCASPVRDEQGCIIGAIFVFRDVTNQRREERALREKEELSRRRTEQERDRLLKVLRETNERLVVANLRTKGLLHEIDAQRRLFQSVIENAPVGIALLRGPRYVLELVNPAYQAFAPGKLMLGKPYAKVWPETAAKTLPILDCVRRTGEPFHSIDLHRTIHRFPGGPLEDAYFTMAILPFHVPGDRDEGLLIVSIETTEQVLARGKIEVLAEEAQRRAAELQSVLDNMADGVFVCDREGRITLSNEAGARMLGLDCPDVPRHSLPDLPELFPMRHPDGSPFTYDEQPLVRALRGEDVLLEDGKIHNPQTKLDSYLRTTATPIRDDRGSIVGAVAATRDVTELAELDQLKDAFISVAAHELKTPVAVMKGYAQALLRTEVDLGAQRRGMLDAIDRGADRIDRIVRELLDISRLQLGHLELAIESIDLPAMVVQVVDRIALTAPEHRLRVVSTEPAVVKGDRDRLEQVLVNLLDNAIRYSPTEREIEVGVMVR
ncbi:MAG: PAS domain-containing protein, partial [Chloroflexota bacterium]